MAPQSSHTTPCTHKTTPMLPHLIVQLAETTKGLWWYYRALNAHQLPITPKSWTKYGRSRWKSNRKDRKRVVHPKDTVRLVLDLGGFWSRRKSRSLALRLGPLGASTGTARWGQCTCLSGRGKQKQFCCGRYRSMLSEVLASRVKLVLCWVCG